MSQVYIFWAREMSPHTGHRDPPMILGIFSNTAALVRSAERFEGIRPSVFPSVPGENLESSEGYQYWYNTYEVRG